MATPNGFTPGIAHQKLLTALADYRYLTVKLATKACFSPASEKWALRLLQDLVRSGYVFTTEMIWASKSPNPPLLYELDTRGVRYLQKQGVDVHIARVRHEQGVKQLFVDHQLEINAVVIAARNLVRHHDHVELAQVLPERVLKHNPVKVEFTLGEKTVTEWVVPDAWLDFRFAGSPDPFPVSIELDRGTEEQKKWRRKVAALSVWARKPYRELFGTDSLTIAVLNTVGGEHRRDNLRRWTLAELTRQGVPGLAQVFLFATAQPAAIPPEELYLAPIWLPCEGNTAESLLEAER